MSNPLVTIGITCFNDESYLRQCLDSVLGQTYQPIEIMVVDDCSTDGTNEILSAYEHQVRIIRHASNSGSLVQGRKDVIVSASGQYVGHLDADDMLEPDFVSRHISEFARDPELDWVASNVKLVDGSGKLIQKWSYDKFPTYIVQALFQGFQNAAVALPKNGIFKMSFIKQNSLSWYQFPNTAQGEDALTCVKYLECNPKVKLINEFLWSYRMHESNMSSVVAERIKMIIDLKEYYIERFNEMVYMFDPAMLTVPYNSDQYNALKYYLIAKDFLNARNGFKMPRLHARKVNRREIEPYLTLFDPVIRKYARKSLDCCDAYSEGVDALLCELAGGHDFVKIISLMDKGSFCDAQNLLTKILEEDSKSIHALRMIGECCYATGDIDAAEQHMANALKLSPNDPLILNDAGVIFFGRGDYSRANAAFDRALSENPDLEDAHLNRCNLAGTAGKRGRLDSSMGAKLVSSLQWLSQKEEASARSAILEENMSLRSECMTRFGKIYTVPYRIMLHQPSNGALKYLMESWRQCLNHMGIQAYLLPWGVETQPALERFQPDLLITVADPAFFEHLDTDAIAKYRRDRGLVIGHISTFEAQFEPCDFYITFHLDPSRDPIMSRADKPLVSVPFAFNPIVHYMRPGRELWDFFFVGTNSPFKKEETEQYLAPLVMASGYSGILAGVDWNIGLGELSVADAVWFYNSARIYPNYHIARQMNEFNEVNERTYILPAMGGFQLVDNPVAMSELFGPDEMAVASSPSEYQEMFAHFLVHPQKRNDYIQRGMRRAWRSHNLFERLVALIEFLKSNGLYCSDQSQVLQPIGESRAVPKPESAVQTD